MAQVQTANVDHYMRRRRAEIGERVKEARREKKWSQEAIADYLGCSRTRIIRAENGQTEFSVAELELIAEIFGVSLLYLLDISLSLSIKGANQNKTFQPVLV